MASRGTTSLLRPQPLGDQSGEFLPAEHLRVAGVPSIRAHKTCLHSKPSLAGEYSPASIPIHVPFQGGRVRLPEENRILCQRGTLAQIISQDWAEFLVWTAMSRPLSSSKQLRTCEAGAVEKSSYSDHPTEDDRTNSRLARKADIFRTCILHVRFAR
jgi:hypothetical protein